MLAFILWLNLVVTFLVGIARNSIGISLSAIALYLLIVFYGSSASWFR